jgi:hypothetical protein
MLEKVDMVLKGENLARVMARVMRRGEYSLIVGGWVWRGRL